MTVTQIVVVVVGLITGYCVVNYLLSSGKGGDEGASGSSSNGEGRESDDQQHAKSGQREHSDDSSAWHDAPSSSVYGAWYEVLDVNESASMPEIDRAYRVQISRYHPDKVTKLGEDIQRLAEARSKEINRAYDIASELRRRWK